MKSFITGNEFSLSEANDIFNYTKQFKDFRSDRSKQPLRGESWGLLFFKNSTRTRISFEVGINELGGYAVVIDSNSTQISRGETIEDTARVLSRYLNGLVIRTFCHEDLETFAKFGKIPIVNALTDFLHPCQVYADIFTLAERWRSSHMDWISSLEGKKIAFLGDTACNMANSWILAANLFGMKISLGGPKDFQPKNKVQDLLKDNGFDAKAYHYTEDPKEAVSDADVVYTDVWISMGDEDDKENRIRTMRPYSVNPDLMKLARPGALFMHCLPAHCGEEVDSEVLESDASIIFDQAENRLHTQKAILYVLNQI